MNSKVTIREVAQAAGVSIGTASRALNRTGRVSADAIATVTRVARELGYQPNALAQSMRTQSTQVVGLLVSDIANPLYAGIITAIEARLVSAGYSLLLANTHGDANREKSLIDLFRRRRVDGLIVCPCDSEKPEMLERLDKDLPVVSLDRDFTSQGVGIHVDHHNGALQATRYLLNLGHRRIALLTPASTLRPGRERIAGYLKAFAEQGIEHDPQLIRAESSAMEFSFSDSLSLLSMPEPPTAFLCLGTRILAGVLQALRHSGRSIPGDVSVVSIGDTDLSQLFSPSITSLTWDLAAVGTACAELLLRRLSAGGRTQHERILITTQMLLRESCGPAPTSPFQPSH
ncbi:transcriptional regulator [Alicycliphilus denitrificans]|uniref:LacI family DNA-binding transcriptional regulator n=1 Tax=Alicycliphilus denitrificans TaxID=179636 RepID=UPI001915E1F7|nr:substrate-binding domain-containing protein [Alicycliphilus denitrificans]BCN38230.1 transcriptional regulator [Alicycliphilus denitrificans]